MTVLAPSRPSSLLTKKAGSGVGTLGSIFSRFGSPKCQVHLAMRMTS